METSSGKKHKKIHRCSQDAAANAFTDIDVIFALLERINDMPDSRSNIKSFHSKFINIQSRACPNGAVWF